MLSIENCVRLFPEGINSQRLPAFKELNARFTKGFGLGGLDLTGYLDVRNLLNFKNVIQVFAVNGDVRNDDERAENLEADLDDLATERDNEQRGRARRSARPHLRRGGRSARELQRLGEQQATSGRRQLRVPDPRRGALRQRRPRLHGRRADATRSTRCTTSAAATQEQYGAPRRARLGFEINF